MKRSSVFECTFVFNGLGLANRTRICYVDWHHSSWVNMDDGLDILFVEDSDPDAELTVRNLRNSERIGRITRVRDGVEALEFVFQEGQFAKREGGLPDLILLDLNLPRVGGIEMLQTLRSDALTRALPVVVLTNSDDARALMESYQLGALGFLRKPLAFSAFAEVIAQIGLLHLT
jgi:two-component system, response regulator